MTENNLGTPLQAKLLSSSNEFETSSSKTEDSLLTTRSNSETNSLSKGQQCCKRNARCGIFCGIFTGLILSFIGTFLLCWTPFQILMWTRLEMFPGLPPFEWWKDPPQEIRLRAYVFNVTNSEEFLSGAHQKLRLQEVGPIVYLEHLQHKNVYFNDNGTLSYTVNRTAVYLPDDNTIDLNSEIIVPNFALLGMASHISQSSYFVKFGFKMLLRGLKTPLFVKTTIQNYLWNFTDPLLVYGQTMEPEMVPDLNIGMLNIVYRNFEDNATVYVGTKYQNERFFLLDKFDGTEYLPGHGEECHDLVVNSTEGALYPQYVKKEDTLRYWRKTLCKVVHLQFEREFYSEKYGLPIYRFIKTKDNYERKENLTTDCYKGNPILPTGLLDLSKCYNGIPMAASFPHYMYAGEEVQNYVEGLKPNETLHESFVHVEPITGIPVESIARSQSNMIVRDTSDLNEDLQKFSNMAVPMFWLEYHQIGLPYYVRYLLIFTVKILPNCQFIFVSLFLILGSYLLVKNIRKIKKHKNNYLVNSRLHFEKESFINKA